MTATARLALPFLTPGQAQKEWFHNEALQALDLVVAAAVEEPPRAAPPGAPVVGSCFIVAAGASGAWAGHEQQLAAFTVGGWRFVPAVEGMSALVRSNGIHAIYRSGAWEIGTLAGTKLMLGGVQLVGARGAAIADPSGGTTNDTQGRTAITQILGALRTHGLIAG